MVYKQFKSKIIKFCVFFFLFISFNSCQQDISPYVPDVPIYYELGLTSELANLGVNQLVTITASPINSDYSIVNYHNSKLPNFTIAFKTYGNGVILYRTAANEYQAFDITCTYRGLEDHCALKVTTGDLVATCPCCKSEFLISSNGYPSTGSKAGRPLLQYTCSFTDDGMYLVISK